MFYIYSITAIIHNKGDEKRGKDGIEEMQFKERISGTKRVISSVLI